MAVHLVTAVAGAADHLARMARFAGLDVVLELPIAGLTKVDQSLSALDLLLLDLRGESVWPSELTALRRRRPGMAVIVVASDLDPALMLEAMRAGVGEFVTEPVGQDDLEAAIARVAGDRTNADERGPVIGFVGAKGGVGTTTIAVNVATALSALLDRGRCLFVDLHQTGGTASVFLGVEPKFSILDALDNTHRLDATFLRSIVARAGDNLDLLASPDSVASVELDGPRIRVLLDAGAAAYACVVVDVPRSQAALMEAFSPDSRLVVVANRELATVRTAGRLVAALQRRYIAGNVSMVLSRSDRQGDIGQRDIERVIGSRIAEVFPSDYRVALEALSKGRPIVLESRNGLSTAFRKFAERIAGVQTNATHSPRTKLLDRLIPRRV